MTTKASELEKAWGPRIATPQIPMNVAQLEKALVVARGSRSSSLTTTDRYLANLILDTVRDTPSEFGPPKWIWNFNDPHAAENTATLIKRMILTRSL